MREFGLKKYVDMLQAAQIKLVEHTAGQRDNNSTNFHPDEQPIVQFGLLLNPSRQHDRKQEGRQNRK